MSGNDRYHSFSTRCAALSIDFLIFKNERGLRYHTVKHLFAEEEWKKAWFRCEGGAFTLKKMISAKKKLKEKGCPYYLYNAENPPCHVCRFFELWCKDIVKNWDNHYVNIIKQAIATGLSLPRFVYYLSHKSINSHSMRTILIASPFPVAFIVCQCPKNYLYEVKTAYHIQFDPYAKKDIMRMTDVFDKAIFCTPDTWFVKLST
ncbi:MAG: hypothetical protein KA807_10605 [Prolixibacteraceae bacterium]|nr:hypothetical protein [Prolixibacteraceae bacterium]